MYLCNTKQKKVRKYKTGNNTIQHKTGNKNNMKHKYKYKSKKQRYKGTPQTRETTREAAGLIVCVHKSIIFNCVV